MMTEKMISSRTAPATDPAAMRTGIGRDAIICRRFVSLLSVPEAVSGSTSLSFVEYPVVSSTYSAVSVAWTFLLVVRYKEM